MIATTIAILITAIASPTNMPMMPRATPAAASTRGTPTAKTNSTSKTIPTILKMSPASFIVFILELSFSPSSFVRVNIRRLRWVRSIKPRCLEAGPSGQKRRPSDDGLSKQDFGLACELLNYLDHPNAMTCRMNDRSLRHAEVFCRQEQSEIIERGFRFDLSFVAPPHVHDLTQLLIFTSP